jgi:hypothetical protein
MVGPAAGRARAEIDEKQTTFFVELFSSDLMLDLLHLMAFSNVIITMTFAARPGRLA